MKENKKNLSSEIRVYVCVTGDLFHFGHVKFFKRARTFGDQLIVGICSDEAVAEYKRTPVMLLNERVEVISACKYVDEVIISAPAVTSRQLIESNQLDVVVATKAYSEHSIQKYYSDAKNLGILRLVDYEPGISSTEIIHRCYNLYRLSNGNLGKL